MAQTLQIPRDASGSDVPQCQYAAAFLVPGIADVSYDNGIWTFVLDQPADSELLSTRLGSLIERYRIEDATSNIAFQLEPPADAHLPGLPDVQPEAQEIALGLNIYDAPFARLIRFLDDAILKRFVPVFHPCEESYPNVIPVESLAKANHISSFPEHLHFVSHLESDVKNLDEFAAATRGGNVDVLTNDSARFAPIQLVQNPSTCYHCYARRTGQDIGENTAVTAITKCHRYEAINLKQPGRLLEFSLREIIFLGTPDYVRETRAQSVSLIENLVKDWSIFGSLISANDPFFSSDYANKATHQQRLALKYEYKALFPPNQPLSVLSSNLHGPTFSKAFSISQQGQPINTGCIGFGLERLALVLIAQHGSDFNDWPENLAGEFARWRANDPLGG